MNSSKGNLRRSRLPSRWTPPEIVKLHDLQIAPYIPIGKAWPTDRVEREDLANDTPIYFGDPAADSKMLTLWIGVPHEIWKTEWWRWCFEIRYRYGELNPIELLGKQWASRIRTAARATAETWDNAPVLTELDSEPTQPKCLRFLATELARDCVRANRERPGLEIDPWTQPIKNSTLWRYLRTTRPEHFGTGEYFRYIETGDDTYESLIGRILYFVQSAEDWFYNKRHDYPPELASLDGLIEKPEFPRPVSNDDLTRLVVEYKAKLDIPFEDFMSILEVWLQLSVYDQYLLSASKFTIINTASRVLESLRPDIHAELLQWVHELRRELVYPQVHGSRHDECYWRSKLARYRGALEGNPLLNCVLHTTVFHSAEKVEWPKYKKGRPAETNRGKACAFVVRLLRRRFPKQSPLSVNELTKQLELSGVVRSSVPKDIRFSVYALAAPILSAILQTQVTHEQIKANAGRYDAALMKDKWLRRYTARFSEPDTEVLSQKLLT